MLCTHLIAPPRPLTGTGLIRFTGWYKRSSQTSPAAASATSTSGRPPTGTRRRREWLASRTSCPSPRSAAPRTWRPASRRRIGLSASHPTTRTASSCSSPMGRPTTRVISSIRPRTTSPQCPSTPLLSARMHITRVSAPWRQILQAGRSTPSLFRTSGTRHRPCRCCWMASLVEKSTTMTSLPLQIQGTVPRTW
ncbi:hypothetical protein PVAP13_3KG487102 [Panicum virgatum]|uniref:Uncharacterized protein n=1 Tax=Panicum virgatum TaxID=38727 RepID=A0A8T0VA75_PANVG|nr:hypothetical protein PVAP13_3KG487102 [Panicum virgatum]